MFITFIKTIFASAIMGIVVYLIYYKLGALVSGKKIIDMLILLSSIAVGAIVYFIVCILLKVEEVSTIFRARF